MKNRLRLKPRATELSPSRLGIDRRCLEQQFEGIVDVSQTAVDFPNHFEHRPTAQGVVVMGSNLRVFSSEHEESSFE